MNFNNYQKILFKAFSKHYKENSDVWTEQTEMRIIPALIQGKLKLNAHARLLDIGCGGGDDAIFFSKIVSQVIGIDIVEHKRWADINQHYKNIKLIRSDFSELKNLNQFEVILDNGCLHHQLPSNYNNYLKTVSKSLAADGWYVLTTFNDLNSHVEVDNNQRLHKYFADNELKELLLSNELIIKDQLDIYRQEKNNFYRISYIKKCLVDL